MLLQPWFQRHVPICAAYQALLKDPKIQEMMAAVMDGGTEKMAKYVNDPASFGLLTQLVAAMEKANLKGLWYPSKRF